MERIVFIITITLLAPSLHAQETTYLSNLGQTSTGSATVGSDSWVAAEFVTGTNGRPDAFGLPASRGYLLDSIQLAMAGTSGNPGNFTLTLYSAYFQGPGTTPTLTLRTNLGVLNGSTDPSTAGIYTFTPTSSLTLTAITPYAIVLSTETPVANGAYAWSYGDTGGTYNANGGWRGGGPAFFSDNDGSSWSYNPSNPQFAINAIPIPVPEPSPSWLLLLGGTFIYARRAHLSRESD